MNGYQFPPLAKLLNLVHSASCCRNVRRTDGLRLSGDHFVHDSDRVRVSHARGGGDYCRRGTGSQRSTALGLNVGALLIGALLGDCVMYFIGHHFGRRLLEKNRFWNRIITPEREKKVEAAADQHGVKGAGRSVFGRATRPHVHHGRHFKGALSKIRAGRFVLCHAGGQHLFRDQLHYVRRSSKPFMKAKAG